MSTSTLKPRVNVYEDENAFTIEAEMPGVPADQASVEVHDGFLTLSGRRANGEASNGARIRERFAGNYQRAFRLGEGVDPENIAARLSDGVLQVTLPKAPRAQRRVVPVQ